MISEPIAAANGARATPLHGNLLRVLRYGFTAAVLIAWGTVLHSRWGELSAREWSLNMGLAAIAVLAFCFYFLGLAAGWALIVRSAGYNLPLNRAVGVWLLSMPARYLPGNLWHIAARVHLAGSYRVPADGVVASSAIEQVLTVLSAALLGLSWLPFGERSWWTGWVAAIFGLCLLASLPPVIRLLLRLGSRLLRRSMPVFALGHRQTATLFLWYGLVNAGSGVGFLLLSDAATTSLDAPWLFLISAYCLAYVVGYASFLTPSGIGVREAVLVSMLGIYMPLPLAVTLSLLARLLSTVAEGMAVLLVGLPLASRPQRRLDGVK